MSEKDMPNGEQGPDPNAPDFTLPDGRAIRFDLRRMTVTEWRSLWDMSKADPEGEDAIIAKVAGLQPDELGNMDYLTWRRMVKAFYEAARRPIGPN